METLETDVGGSNRGDESLPREEGQGLPDAAQRGNRMQAAGTALKAPKCTAKIDKTAILQAAAQPNRLSNGPICLSCRHDRAFPLPEYLCGTAGELLRPGGADPGRRAAADQIEPPAGDPSRPRSGSARQSGGG